MLDVYAEYSVIFACNVIFLTFGTGFYIAHVIRLIWHYRRHIRKWQTLQRLSFITVGVGSLITGLWLAIFWQLALHNRIGSRDIPDFLYDVFRRRWPFVVVAIVALLQLALALAASLRWSDKELYLTIVLGFAASFFTAGLIAWMY